MQGSDSCWHYEVWRFLGLLEALETLFGRNVDLVVDSTVTNPYFRQSIERRKTLLYAG